MTFGLLLGVAAPVVGDCLDVPSIPRLVACLAETMPGRGSGQYRPPTAGELARWEAHASALLDGRCPEGPLADLPGVVVRSVDDDRRRRRDCVMVDVLDADADGRPDRAWGMFAVAAAPRSGLHLQVPHPIFDADTDTQGAALYVALGARSFAMAGAHRYASAARDPRTDGALSDPTHSPTHPLVATTRAITGLAEDWLVVQLHGMAAASCPDLDVFVSPGPVPAGDRSRALADALGAEHAGWRLGTPAAGPACRLAATENVQGRTILVAKGERGGFLSVEQAPGFRGAADWEGALAAVAPPVAAVARR